MLPYTISGKAEFKKEYNFIWMMELNEELVPKEPKMGETITPNNWTTYKWSDKGWDIKSIFERKMVNYICQLCKSVELPDDEIETEEIPVGPAVYKMPSRVAMQDITVTYLEDSLNSVYNFHKAWFSLLRKNGLQSPFKYCAKGTYKTFDRTLNQFEAAMFRNIGTKAVNAIGSYLSNSSFDYGNMFGSVLGSGRSEGDTSGTGLDLTTKPTGSTVYNCIYPTKISRSPGDKTGTQLSEVTITYARLPKLPIIPGNYYDKVASADVDVNTQLTDKAAEKVTAKAKSEVSDE